MTDGYWYQVWGPPARPGNRPNLSVILPDLLIGEYPLPEDAAWLATTHGVTAVISLQDDADLASKGLQLPALERAYGAHGIRFHRIAVPDGDSDTLAARLDGILTLLSECIAGGCAYLHCNAGMNRAPTIAIAYLHTHRQLSLNDARDFVKQRRHCVPYMRVLEACYANGAPRTASKKEGRQSKAQNRS